MAPSVLCASSTRRCGLSRATARRAPPRRGQAAGRLRPAPGPASPSSVNRAPRLPTAPTRRRGSAPGHRAAGHRGGVPREAEAARAVPGSLSDRKRPSPPDPVDRRRHLPARPAQPPGSPHPARPRAGDRRRHMAHCTARARSAQHGVTLMTVPAEVLVSAGSEVPERLAAPRTVWEMRMPTAPSQSICRCGEILTSFFADCF